MDIFAIDLETTGLDSSIHGVTEFAAVFGDLWGQRPVKTFYVWINPEGYVWSQYCLDLHAKWLLNVNARIKAKQFDGDPIIVPNMQVAFAHFKTWLFTQCDWPVPSQDGKWEKLIAAGKNFGSFDLGFLKKAGWPDIFRHRSLDPTLGYIRRSDKFPPELKVCKERAIADGAAFESAEVKHSAIADAMDVLDLLRFYFRGKVTSE